MRKLHLLRQLQEKPETTRRHIAFGVTIVSTGVIVLVWLSLLYRNSLQRQETVRDASNPLELFSEQLQEGWATVKEEYGTAKGTLDELFNTLPEDVSTTTSSSSSVSTPSESDDFYDPISTSSSAL